MTYDDYKLATPPEEVRCEMCGTYTDKYRIIDIQGEITGWCLCPECAEEKIEETNQTQEYEQI